MSDWRDVPCRDDGGDPTHHPRERNWTRPGRSLRGAHQVAWEIANGTLVPDGFIVCHHCDNRRCIEPAHLFLGTHSDNMLDARDKGRLVIPGGFVLDMDSARAIREAFSSGETRRQIATRTGLSYSTVRDVIAGKTWREWRGPAGGPPGDRTRPRRDASQIPQGFQERARRFELPTFSLGSQRPTWAPTKTPRFLAVMRREGMAIDD